jgi:TonB-linked SusC/RagA family outer membrane protein
MKKIVLFTVSLFLTATAVAQTRTITGKVTDATDGSGMISVSILIQGTNKGVSTDLDGNYSIELAPGETTLIFSFIGYKPQTVEVGDRALVDVVMEVDATNLEELVVIGYGTQRKRDVTGSIVTIKGAELADKPNGNPLNSIQGKVSGVQVINSGSAGSSPTIRVRGIGSLSNQSGSTAPLYVVDGIFANNIDFVNPGDIESMEILKDASSLAIYGVQGANGVIIISTKRAKQGQTTINVGSYAGFQYATNRVDVTNAAQFKMLYNEELSNTGNAPYDFSAYTADTDWQDQILRSAFIMNHNISINSATERHQTSFSLNYFKQDGVVKYDSYSRYAAHLKDDFTINKHVKVGADITLFHWTRDPQRVTLNNAIWAMPVYAPKAADGHYNSAPSLQRTQVGNPVATMEILKDKIISDGYRVVGSGYVELSFLKNFTWKSTAYTDLGFNKTRGYTPKYSIGSAATGDLVQVTNLTSVNQSNDTYVSWQMDHLLTYSQTLNEDHYITVLGGITQRYAGSEYINGSRQGKDPLPIPNDPNLWFLDVGDNDPTRQNGGGGAEEVFLSFLGRVNYAFKDKYLLNASYRRDGTSKFNPFNRWGNFGSIGAGWVVTEESFMNFETLNFLKLKASWGRLGNDKIGNNLYYPVLNTGIGAVFGENVYRAAVPAYIPNPNIRWEIVQGIDIGFESRLLENKLSVEFSYYDRKTEDILVDVPIPTSVGIGLSQINAGTIQNKGIELALGWSDQFSDDWRYSVSGNITTLKNEVIAIGDNKGYNIIGNPTVSVTEKGHPAGAFFGYIQEGIFQTQGEIDSAPTQTGVTVKPGDIRYKDVDKDGDVDDDDRTFIGSPIPDVMYGVSLGVSYKRFDLSIDLQGVAGNEIYRQRSTSTFAPLNYTANRLDRWVGPGSSDKEPIMDNSRPNNFLASTYFLDNGAYFRIRNVSLGYNFSPEFLQRVKITSAKVYVNAQNVFTFTKATGYSPEVGGSPISAGIDNGVYPIPATYTLGLNLNF